MVRSADWMRGAFCCARPPDRIASTSSSMGACSTASQSGAAASAWSPMPPQPGRLMRSSRSMVVAEAAAPPGRSRARISGPQALERVLRVHIGAVLGQDREHQLAGRFVDARPDRLPVAGRRARPARTAPGRVVSGRVVSPTPSPGRAACAWRASSVAGFLGVGVCGAWTSSRSSHPGARGRGAADITDVQSHRRASTLACSRGPDVVDAPNRLTRSSATRCAPSRACA